MFKLIQGDCVKVLASLPVDSVDAVVTDPPYNLSFMSKDWDDLQGSQPFQEWCSSWGRECLRVLKPGGFLLAFGGTRTHHRLTCGLEDAGFIVRDELMWGYASGFPKAQALDKLIDKKLGVDGEREVVGVKGLHSFGNEKSGIYKGAINKNFTKANELTTYASPEARAWVGWKTPALKPAWEPIVLCQKPCEGSITENVLKYGVGGFNIDACRIPYQSERDQEDMFISSAGLSANSEIYHQNPKYHLKNVEGNEAGRFPSNLLLTDGILSKGVEGVVLANYKPAKGHSPNIKTTGYGLFGGGTSVRTDEKEDYYLPETGSYNKFFLIPKAGASEKHENPFGDAVSVGESELAFASANASGQFYNKTKNPSPSTKKNFHPKVKPLRLMEYLVKLVTREGAVVLDPFLGSGTTLLACRALNRSCIGIEQSPEYCEIVKARFGNSTLGEPLEVVGS